MAVDNYKEAIRDRKMNVQMADLEGLPHVQGDLQRLCQAFGNLVGNAIKFTPDGGNITISGRTLEDNSNGHPQVFVEVMFADTGIGIDVADQSLIFEKFYRVREHENKAQGTGLGLSISKQIIQGHNGRIEVKSKMGVGTSFTIHIPRIPRTIPRNDSA